MLTQFFKTNTDIAKAKSQSFHVGPVEDAVVCQQPHPIIEHNALNFGGPFRIGDQQINGVAPVETVAILDPDRIAYHIGRGAAPLPRPGFHQRPDAPVRGAIVKGKILDQPQARTIPVALHGDGKTAPDCAEHSLILSLPHDFAIEELLDMEGSVADERVGERGLARAGRQRKKAESKQYVAHHLSFFKDTRAGFDKFSGTRERAVWPPAKHIRHRAKLTKILHNLSGRVNKALSLFA